MENKSKSQSTFAYIALTALKLLVICAFIATLVAAVNFITKDRIAYNQKMNTASALSDIYSSDGMVFSVSEDGGFKITDESGNPLGSCENADADLDSDVDAVYIIKDENGEVFGYCVETSPMGFKDEIDLLVAVNPDSTIKDVKVISLSETKGIGDKIRERTFLDKFKGRKEGFSQSTSELKSIIISGATRTSEPVTIAIDNALAQIGKMFGEVALG